MLSRIFSLHSRTHLRRLSFNLTQSQPPPPSPIPKSFFTFQFHRHFSTNNNGGDDDDRDPASNLWSISQEPDDIDDIFGVSDRKSNIPVEDSRKVPTFDTEKSWDFTGSEIGGGGGGKVPTFDTEKSWDFAGSEIGGGGGKVPTFDTQNSWDFAGSEISGGGGGEEDIFAVEDGGDGGGGGEGVVDSTPWELEKEEKEGKVDDIFGDVGVGGDFGGDDDEEREIVTAAQKLQLEKEEQSLLQALKGPDRAFGDLVAASGITDAMLDSLIALKNFEDIEGLPPLTQIEDERYLKTLKKSSRYALELQKQEDAAKSRVRKVDEKGRAYGTGKRKCSIARVWIQPGEGKFSINDKEFDVYFPMLDHRAALLRPFSETKTLGLWDVRCNVKGGGTTGQVDAIRLGISRAIQNWEPGLRPPLRQAGLLTRDPRIVERKKPGKAKARKSFQWVKR